MRVVMIIEMSWHVNEEVVSRDMTGEDIKWISVEQDPRPVKPNAQRKMNWTELLVQFSSVQFPAVHWTGDDPRRFGDEIGGRHTFFTIGVHCQPAKSIIGRKPATAGDGRCRSSWRQENNLRRPLTVVAARRRFNIQRKTELNWTTQFSSVE